MDCFPFGGSLPRDGYTDHVRDGSGGDRAGDRDCYPSPGPQHTVELGQALDWVGKEHQTKMTDHCIKDLVSEGKPLPIQPHQRDRLPLKLVLGGSQHGNRDVTADDVSGQPNPLSSGVGCCTGPGGNVEDTVVLRKTCGLDESRDKKLGDPSKHLIV